MKQQRKKLFARQKSRSGHEAQPITISLYPDHRALVERRVCELNIHRSVIFQLLLDIEAQHGLLRQEANRRLTPAVQTANNAIPQTHEINQ